MSLELKTKITELPPAFLGRTFLFMTVFLFSALKMTAQVDIPIGINAGPTNTFQTYPCPLQDDYEGSRAQYLYTATELIAAGMGPGNIVAIKWNVNTVGTAGIIEQYTLKIGGTNISSLDLTSWIGGTTTIFGPADYQPVVGANTFNLSTPFFWNGTDNIIIEPCNGDPITVGVNTYSNNATVFWTTGLAFNGSHSYRADNLDYLCGTPNFLNTGVATTRPNIVFSWVAAPDCAGTPVAGLAQANPTSVCLGDPFTLSLIGNTLATGVDVQWQASQDNSTFSDIAGATALTYTTTQSVSTYYRAILTCTNAGGGQDISTSVHVLSPTLVGGTFTINNGPAGDFHSFNEAYDFIKCGINDSITFNVIAGSGPYNEQLIMNPVPGASGINKVTFNCNGATLNFLSSNSNERAGIKLNGADNIHFNNLKINATGIASTEFGYGIQLLNDADSNEVNGCTITINTSSNLPNYAGIVISASATNPIGTGNTFCDFNKFSNNIVQGGYYGMTLVGNLTSANFGNTIFNNVFRDFYTTGFYLLGTSQTTIEANTFTRPTRTDGAAFTGILSTQLSISLNISRNKITNPFGGAPTATTEFTGISFTNNDGFPPFWNVVSNNLIYNINGGGDNTGFFNSGSDNVFYYFNTISMDGSGASSTVSNFTRGFSQTNPAAGIEFMNNIISITRGGQSTKIAIAFNTAISSILSDYNDFYINAVGGINYIGYHTTNWADLFGWQNSTLQDAHSITSDPAFNNPIGGDFMPTNASIDNLGTAVLTAPITIDIRNTPRNATTPDMGAFEFNPGPCTQPPTPGTPVLGSSTVCEGAPLTLAVMGNTTGTGQTYQWQTSTTPGGPYTPLGNPLTNPDTTIFAPGVNTFYNLAVTCAANPSVASSAISLTVIPRLSAGPVPYTIGAGGDYPNFNAAKAAMACGIKTPIVFNVIPGSAPFNEQLILDSIPGISATNTVTFNGNGNTIWFTPTVNNQRAVIKLKKVNHIIFDNLVIDASQPGGTYGYGIQLVNNADSNTFRNCVILAVDNSNSEKFGGIIINASETAGTTNGSTFCDGNSFDENVISGGYWGVTLVGSAGAFLNGNKFTRNNIQEFYQYGIYVSNTTNTLIEKNNFSRPSRTNVALTTFYGIYFTGNSSNALISKNKINNPFGGDPVNVAGFNGIFFANTGAPNSLPIIVSNNLITDIQGPGIQWGIVNSGSENIKYYHNTISLDDQGSSNTNSARGFVQLNFSSGIEFKNNIIKITRAGIGPKHAIYFGGDPGSQITSDYNDLYVAGTAGINAVGFNGIDRLTLTDWQTGTTPQQDLHSVSYDPEFVDPPNGDYSPSMIGLDNLGIPLGVTTDILDATRSTTTPDMGAYEFAVAPCTVPPTAGSAVAVPNTDICMGTQILLSLANNSIGGGQTYQWQSSPDGTTNWTNISPVQFVSYLSWTLGIDTYFRAVVTCSGNSVNSTVEHINRNPAFLKGYYTINPASTPYYPASSNFQNFASAVAAMDCGITGFVTFDVSPGTYTEQIRMHKISGATDTSRVTFRSLTGDPASVILTNAAVSPAPNYTLKLDSASFITYKDMTIEATDAINGRVVELANTASFDSLTNCIINAPVVTVANDLVGGVYANLLTGSKIVINKNKINNGAFGISFAGKSTIFLSTKDDVIDSNTVNGFYQYGIFARFTNRIKLTNNTVNLTGPNAAEAYGMLCSSCDTGYVIHHNNVNFTNTTGIVNGIYIALSNANRLERGRVSSNKITAGTGNTSTMYGLYETTSSFNNTINNVISVNTTGASFGIFSTTDFQNNYLNNTVNNWSSSATANVAAYFNHTSGAEATNIQNNIFANNGGGWAMQVTNSNFIYSDYNFLYTTGPTLVRFGATNLATLQDWINATSWDVNSMVYRPAFVSNTDLHPLLSDPDVWAIHGRGLQIEGNDKDFDLNPRPTTLTTGVPDMGAYEFVPTSVPTVLVGNPATPAPNTTQTFMYGTDTVVKITYDAASTVPTDLTFQRYSGVIDPGLNVANQPSMYFYSKATVTGSQPSKFSIKKFYIDPWQGYINNQANIKLGRTTDAAVLNSWVVNADSKVDEIQNFITDTSLNYMDRFTGLTDGDIPPPPVVLPPLDTSNRGRRFWVGYGHHQGFENTNDQDMKLYLSAEDDANVVVKVNGTPYVREYFVPAGTVITSEAMPKTGIYDARLLIDGKSSRGISIESDVPIVAYAHIYAKTTSEAAMLLPVGTYGYEYTTLTTEQEYSTDTYSWTYVIADNDSTKVEINPSNFTLSGSPGRIPFTVYLNKGEVYQVLGALVPGTTEGYDMTGTTIKSIPNDAGKCYPIAVFSGSSRTNIDCIGSNAEAHGDNIFEQNFPFVAWGKRYLTAPTSSPLFANRLQTNIFRIAVKDPATIVLRNGSPLSPLIGGFYYEYESITADYIEADKPIMVAQIMASDGFCPNNAGNGDPSMVYLTPIEQGIKKVGLYRTEQSFIFYTYITLIIPTGGIPSLLIDGSGTFDYQYPHPNLPGYTVVVKRYVNSTAQATIKSDSAFTAITYGLGAVESYAYNAGCLIKNLNAIPAIDNVLGTGGVTNSTCANAPFELSIELTLQPTELTWNLSAVSTLTPNADVVQVNPTPVSTRVVDGRTYYRYTVPGTYIFSTPGFYSIPILIAHPDIAGCSNKLEVSLPVTVIAAPFTDFTYTQTACTGETTVFTGIGTTTNSQPISTWTWDFGEPPAGNTQTVSHTFTTPGTFNVNLHIISEDGCVGDTTKVFNINPRPVVDVSPDSLNQCEGNDIVFAVVNPVAGVIYNWYNTPTGGTPVFTGNTFTVSSAGDFTYYVEAQAGSCYSVDRKRVRAILKPLPAITINPDSLASCTGTGSLTFTIQNPDPGATYEWYDAPTGGNILFTGTSITINTTGIHILYASATLGDCSSAIRKRIIGTITTTPTINVVPDSLNACPGDNLTFNVENPIPGATYNWYDAPTGGNLLGTGTSYTMTSVTGTVVVYAETNAGGCLSAGRKRVVGVAIDVLATPVAVVDSAGADFIRFTWNAVPNAVRYEVSVNGGAFVDPTSGPTGLIHTVGSLTPGTTVTLVVRAIGADVCQNSESLPVDGTTIITTTVDIFIPNSFTPNGDALNDVLKIYGSGFNSIRFMVFNQWGEKLNESNDRDNLWDGTQRGTIQPSGVYMYVCELTLADGTITLKKGSINLVR